MGKRLHCTHCGSSWKVRQCRWFWWQSPEEIARRKLADYRPCVLDEINEDEENMVAVRALEQAAYNKTKPWTLDPGLALFIGVCALGCLVALAIWRQH